MFITRALEVGLLYSLTHINLQLVFYIVTVLNYVSVYLVGKTEVDSSGARSVPGKHSTIPVQCTETFTPCYCVK